MAECARYTYAQREEDWARMFAFLGRYGHMDLAYLERQPSSWVRRLAAGVGFLLKEEERQLKHDSSTDT